jgi:hypothetical protein
VEAWQKLLLELPARLKDDDWDVFVCQLITQCGMAAIVPARKDIGDVHDVTLDVGISVELWSRAYEALPDPDDDESRFNKAYDRLHKSQLRALKAAIGDPQLKAQFAALKRRAAFAVFCVDEGDTPIRDRWEFLWGNRPPKREFATAGELFEHLLRKAGARPRYSMRMDGDKVVAVNWFGHEFTDRYVDLLADVPHLATLCDDLRAFVLTATRVTPAGLERLKGLLPRVEFKVASDQEFENGVDPWNEHRTPIVTTEAPSTWYRPGVCGRCQGSGKCYCLRKGPGNATGCARCRGSGHCQFCQGTGNDVAK